MAREKEGFRVQLEMVRQAFPDRDLLSPSDVAAFCGCSLSTVYRRFGECNWHGNGRGKKMTRAELARSLS